MPKLDLAQIPYQGGSGYPGKLAEAVAGRSSQRIGDASGLSQFGVNIVRLEPGALSSLRPVIAPPFQPVRPMAIT
jgi:uncharacterized cupin superfamily protein